MKMIVGVHSQVNIHQDESKPINENCLPIFFHVEGKSGLRTLFYNKIENWYGCINVLNGMFDGFYYDSIEDFLNKEGYQCDFCDLDITTKYI